MPDYGIKKNHEGYPDPTAFAALSKVEKEEQEQQRRVSDLVKVLKGLIDFAGFELIARIELRDKRTGKEYR